MDSFSTPLVLCSVVFALVLVLGLKLRSLQRSYSFLDGPPAEHWFLGSMVPTPGRDPLAEYGPTFDRYGPTYREKGLARIPHLATIDARACSHIFNKTDIYLKPGYTRWFLGLVAGDAGLLSVEGEQHKRIRRIMAPSFALVHIKELVPTFLERASQLVKIIDDRLTAKPHDEVDMKKFTADCTFDIIGAAGFGTELGCMDANSTGQPSELVKAMDTTSDSLVDDQSLLTALQAFLPVFRLIPSQLEKTIAKGTKVVERVGREIIDQKRREILAKSVGDEKVTKEDVGGGKDLLSVILRASMAEDVPENQKLSDEELIAQIVTFIVAGFETSSTAVTLTLEALCDDTSVQDKLRKELLAFESDRPSFDELNDLPYLDAVVKEGLRRYPPAPAFFRTCVQDDMLPLSVPVKNIHTGEMMSEIPIKKGEAILVATQNMQNSTVFFGEDAGKFNPDRWLSPLPPTASDLSPMWSSMATFHGGPRSCIGMRFALIEIKAILFHLIRAFEFSHLDPKPEIWHALTIVSRPMVKGREAEGGMLPVRVRRVV